MPNIYFVDLLNGDDSANGLSFAGRRKSIGGIAPGLSPGDTIRVMESARPLNTSLTASWSNKSASVTLSAAVTIPLIRNAWAAGIAPIFDDTTIFKFTSALRASLPAGVTGKAFYNHYASSISASAYRQISLWLRVDQPIPANKLSIRLCSDTFGGVSVHTIPLPAIAAANQWVPITVDSGSLFTGSFGSVAVYLDGPLASPTKVWVDNIVACLPPGDNRCLTHQTLIGKPNAFGAGGDDTDGWHCVAAIFDTEVLIDQDPAASQSDYMGYYGTGGSFALWKRDPATVPLGGSLDESLNTLSATGTANSPIEVSFGWNADGMVEKSGVTCISGGNGWGTGLEVAAPFNRVSGVAFYRFGRGLWVNGAVAGDFRLTEASHCQVAGVAVSGAAVDNDVIVGIGHNNGGSTYKDHPGGGCNRITVTRSFANNRYGIELAHNDLVRDSRLSYHRLGGLLTGGAVRGHRLTTSESPWAAVVDPAAGPGYDVILTDCFVGEHTPFFSGFTERCGVRVRCHKFEQVPDQHVTVEWDAIIRSHNGVNRHTPTGLSWQISPGPTRDAANPVDLKLASIAVLANRLVTIKCYFNRTTTSITAQLLVPGDQLEGVPSDRVATATTSGDWEQLTVTFTPSEQGVIDIYARAFGGSTASVYVDDMSASQP